MKKDFTKKAYEIVKQIPEGKVMSYGQIAERLGNKRLARAIGNALHKNPDPDNIPCHRVVDRNGKLAKRYAFGGWKEQKRKLLAEGVKFKDKKHVKLSN